MARRGLAAAALVGLAAAAGPGGSFKAPSPSPTVSPLPTATESPTTSSPTQLPTSECNADDFTWKGNSGQEALDEVWENIYERWQALTEDVAMEQEALATENEIYKSMREVETTLGICSGDDDCNIPSNATTVSSKLATIVTIVEGYKSTVDVVAMLMGALFVYIAKFGYLARIVGMVTVNSIKVTVVSDLLSIVMTVIGWWSFGYGFAYGKDKFPDDGYNGLIGGDRYFPMHVNALSNMIGGGQETPESAYTHAEFLLHMGLCIICVGIPVGTLAERATISFTTICSLLVATVIYPVIVHIFWDPNGWFSPYREKQLLFDCGVIDVAGSGVVHATGAVVALSAAVIMDARRGRWTKVQEGSKAELMPKPQYSPTFEAFGCVIIFVTSLATTAFCVRRFTDDGAAVSRAMLNNLLCSGTSSFTACIIGHFYTGVVSPQLAGGGLIAGIATISSGCTVVTPEGAFVMGFVGGIAYYLGGALLVTIRVDDVSHAISMHGFAGIFGLIMTGLFAHPDFYEQAFYDTRLYDSGCYGMFYNGGPTAALTQAYGAMAIIAYAGTISTIVFAILHFTVGTRFPEKMLEYGIDASRFGGETRYADSAANLDKDRFKAINPPKDHDEE